MTEDMPHDDQGTVSRELRGDSLWITLHRPSKHNALSITLIDQLHEAIREAEGMGSAVRGARGRRSLVLCGHGPRRPGTIRKPWRDARSLAEVMIRIRVPVPVIARVKERRSEAGADSAVSDFVISHPEAKLRYPESTTASAQRWSLLPGELDRHGRPSCCWRAA